MHKDAPYPIEQSELIALDLGSRLGLPEGFPIGPAEFVAHLTERFGEPKVEPRDEVQEDLAFDHQDFRGLLIRIATSGFLTGFIILGQVAPPPPPPPPCPGFRGSLMAWGTGTATRTGLGVLIAGPATAIAEATTRANLSLIRSIGAVRLTLCATCPANCTCLWYPSGIDLPLVSVSLIRGFGGFPVGYSVTVWTFQSISATCI